MGTAVSSSRRAPRRPLDRRAFGPLRGGCCCPHANALRSTHRPRRSMLVCPCGPGVRGSVDRQPKQLQALPISACCALACPGLSRACSPWIAGVGRGVVRVVRARLTGHRSGRGEIYFPQGTPPTTRPSRSRHKYDTKERFIQQVRVKDQKGGGGSKKKGALPPLAVAGQALDVLERQLPGGGRGLAELAADLARRRVADSRLRSVRLGPDGA